MASSWTRSEDGRELRLHISGELRAVVNVFGVDARVWFWAAYRGAYYKIMSGETTTLQAALRKVTTLIGVILPVPDGTIGPYCSDIMVLTGMSDESVDSHPIS